MYRVHLFDELLALAGKESLLGRRILEIGPKDGLDSRRMVSLQPTELVLIDLPEKTPGNLQWLPSINCPHQYIEANLMYLPQADIDALGQFDLIWCTGVLYHNAEQLRLLRRLYKLLTVGGYLVLESATARSNPAIRNGCFVEIYYPKTYRDTGTITHLPTAAAINAWLNMVGFSEIYDAEACYAKEDRRLIGQRHACIARKSETEAAGAYAKSGLNPGYRFGDST
jgi:SAM-dependent methyltransferase